MGLASGKAMLSCRATLGAMSRFRIFPRAESHSPMFVRQAGLTLWIFTVRFPVNSALTQANASVNSSESR